MSVKIAIKKIKRQQQIINLRVKLKRIKILTKRQKSKERRYKKIHYKLGLKGETKNNETFIKDQRKINKK
jgi:hypothetical protein